MPFVRNASPRLREDRGLVILALSNSGSTQTLPLPELAAVAFPWVEAVLR